MIRCLKLVDNSISEVMWLKLIAVLVVEAQVEREVTKRMKARMS